MNVGQIVTTLRREGDLTVRDVLVRFDGRDPDTLGPPLRWPLLGELTADPRLNVDRSADRWLVHAL